MAYPQYGILTSNIRFLNVQYMQEALVSPLVLRQWQGFDLSRGLWGLHELW